MCYVSNQIAEYCKATKELECTECLNILTQSDTDNFIYNCDKCECVFIINDHNELELV